MRPRKRKSGFFRLGPWFFGAREVAMIEGWTRKEASRIFGKGLWDATCSFSCPECHRDIFVHHWDMNTAMTVAKSVDVKCPHCETLFNKAWR